MTNRVKNYKICARNVALHFLRYLHLEHDRNPKMKLQENTALHYAVKRNHNLAQMAELLECGADPTLKAKDGTTPISLAKKQGKTKVVAALEAQKQRDPLTHTKKHET